MAGCERLTSYIDKVRTWRYRQCTWKNFTFISGEIQELLKALIKIKVLIGKEIFNRQGSTNFSVRASFGSFDQEIVVMW